jgi:NitT/TauT family transport system permease protein
MWGGLLVIWELSTRFALISRYILPSPWSILEALVEFFPYLLDNSQVTLLETLVGFALGIFGGVFLAIAIGYSDFLRRGLYPMLVAFQAVPKVAIAPVLTVWFGIGLMSKFMMAFFIAFFPIVVNALSGLTDVPTNMVELVQVMRASKPTIFWKIRAPHALPYIFDGAKIALPLAIIGAIIGEFVGSEEGLGNVILITSSQLNMALLFAALVILTVLSLILFALLVWAEKTIVWWRNL